MRRLSLVIIHLLLAAAIFGTIVFQPHNPLWARANIGDECACPVGFHPERGTLICIEGKLANFGNATWHVTQRDSETGRELHRTTIHAPQGRSLFRQPALLDGNRLLLMHGIHINPNRDDTTMLGTYWHDLQGEIVDLQTGERLVGPLNWGMVKELHKSQDVCGGLIGRKWTQVHARVPDPNGNKGLVGEVRVVSLADGMQVLRLPKTDYRQLPVVFSPDNAQVAILGATVPGKQNIIVYALPSGEKQYEYEAPPGHAWQAIEEWLDGKFILKEVLPVGAKRQECYSVPILRDKLGPAHREPHLAFDYGAGSMHRELAGEHVIRVMHDYLGAPDWLQATLRWLDARLNTHWARRNTETSTTVQLADATTGKIVGETSCAEECWTIKVSPDFRRVACNNAVKGLQMWDLQPPARWPWALMLAAAPSALWFGVHRIRRTKRAHNNPASTSPTRPHCSDFLAPES